VCIPVEESTQETVPTVQLYLGIYWIEVDVDSRSSIALLEWQAVHPAKIHEEVCLPYECVHTLCAWAVLYTTYSVNENPAVTEPKPIEEAGGGRDAIGACRVELAGYRVIRECIVSCVFVEPDVVTERTQPKEVVCRLPGVPAERETHQIPSENDQTRLSSHP
jgi:hypothetical protein